MTCFSSGVTDVVTQLGTDDFALALLAFMRDWISIDEACMLFYPEGGGGPIIVRREPNGCSRSPNLDTFVTGVFLLDPYYVAAARERRSQRT